MQTDSVETEDNPMAPILKRAAAVAAAFVAFTASLSAAGLAQLLSAATAVIEGSVNSRVEAPDRVEFAIYVERVVTGSVPASTVHIVHTNWASLLRSSGPTMLSDQFNGLWFLTETPSGSWDVLPARPSGIRTMHNLYLPFAPVTSNGGTVLDELVQEVAAGAQVSYDGATVLMGALDGVDSPATRMTLQAAAASSNADFQAVGVAGLIQREAPGSLDLLLRLWPAIATSMHKNDVISAVRDYWRDSTPASVSQMITLARTTSDGNLRAAAVWALSAIHSRETLPFLGTLLDSQDASEQAQAMYGISAFVNGCPVKDRTNVVSMWFLLTFA